ncbi:MAG TPA: bifunctional homocysteine S-methyltransferase/methylenetetrahydrofolate reductase [Clostridia bacterium]|nr:bifunctional homocysteine S-methyltransferase/methylenetetrahydrofolate reductase [Clostridia bacterium]
MKSIRNYLQKNVLLADGAFGTYISSLLGRNMPSCELLNLKDPELVLNVHKQYVAAGSRLIGTNTFSANTFSLETNRAETDEIIRSGVSLARKAAGENVYVAADIGPVPQGDRDSDAIHEEYCRIADAFLAEDVQIFIFETFADSDAPLFLAEYIKNRVPDAFILTNYTVTSDGYSRMNVKGDKLIRSSADSGFADAAGFNCGCGPAHLVKYASGIDFGGLFPALLPNAGYPQMENDFYLYSGSPEYFASKMLEAVQCGFKIFGGCCGTTPEHIHRLSLALKNVSGQRPIKKESGVEISVPTVRRSELFPETGRKIFIAELDPPFQSDLTKLESCAGFLRDNGVDAVTVADSPMARPRVDSIAVAARLKRKFGIEAVPHITCRDRNLNALRSSLLAAHMENLRNILAVTGDPVSETDRGSVKGVFNLNSAGLCGFIRDMNGDAFQNDPMFCGCAFNVNAKNPEQELHRLEKKINSGATFLLSQPVFTGRSVETLRKAKKMGVKVAAGIIIPVSYRNALFLANEMPGITLPQQNVLERFSPDMTREQGEEAGLMAALEVARKAADFADGFYVIAPFNRVYLTVEFMKRMKRELRL